MQKLTIVLALTAVLAVAAPDAGARAKLIHFKGTVVSVKRSDRSFLMDDLRHSRKFRIWVNRSTSYERGLTGFGKLRRNLDIEVKARRTPGGRYMARHIELD